MKVVEETFEIPSENFYIFRSFKMAQFIKYFFIRVTFIFQDSRAYPIQFLNNKKK